MNVASLDIIEDKTTRRQDQKSTYGSRAYHGVGRVEEISAELTHHSFTVSMIYLMGINVIRFIFLRLALQRCYFVLFVTTARVLLAS